MLHRVISAIELETASVLHVGCLCQAGKEQQGRGKANKKEIVVVIWVKYSITMSEPGNKKNKLVDELGDKTQNMLNENTKASKKSMMRKLKEQSRKRGFIIIVIIILVYNVF